MPWFRLDDSFHSHPKVIAAGNEAVGLFVRCGTYAAQHLTDGFIPEHVVLLYGSPALADTLVRAKLWRRARGGWQIHDYLKYNPTREAVENERKSAAERQRRRREAMVSRRDSRRDTAVSHTTPTRPGSGRTEDTTRPRGVRERASPPGSHAPAAKPPWCGSCDESTRLAGEPPKRCPDCHPLAGEPIARVASEPQPPAEPRRGRHARKDADA